MRMPSILKSTLFAAAATLLATSAAVAGPFGSGGTITTTETSYESLVTKPGDTLNGIFNVSQINGIGGITYQYGDASNFLVGRFTDFVLDTATPFVCGPGCSGFSLLFTGGSLQYYSFASDPFAGGALTSGAPTPANQAAALTAIGLGTLELDLDPQLIDLTHTLQITVLGTSLASFAQASTATVYLDIVGGASAGLFTPDTITNAFTLALADVAYQGSANSQNCSISPRWQVCGTNHATLNVIPEPITVSLFGAGLAGAAALRRRKVKKA
ncbi:MAG TPA: PEP-CTERM sorting domain-containing protein [Rhizomicrobium sp.]|nr:PEP-CTERM sorting domain-containing protein [Rhizomicrobium sp.]